MRTQRTIGGAAKRKLLQGHDEELIRNRIRACHSLDLWVTHELEAERKGNSISSTAATLEILNHVT